MFRSAGVALLAVVCALAAGCGRSVDGAAGGDTVAIVRGGIAFLTDGELETLAPIDTENVADVVFDSDGELWLSTLAADDTERASCDLKVHEGAGRISGEAIRAATDRAMGACELAPGPDGTLYTITHNGTLGSNLVAQVDPKSGAIRDVWARGAGVASTRDGQVMSVWEYRNETHPRGASSPVLTFIGAARNPIELEPETGDPSGYGAVAPRDADMIAAVVHGVIAVGPPSGPLAPRCELGEVENGVVDLAWRSDGHIYARTWEGDLYLCAPDGAMGLVARSVEALAVR